MPGYLLTDICRKYKTAKMSLLKTLTGLAVDETNIQNEPDSKILETIKPFLSDTSTEVQNAAIAFVVQMAQGGKENAILIIQNGLVQEVLRNALYKERIYQSSVFNALTTIGSYSQTLASFIMDVGGLDFLNSMLSSFDRHFLLCAVYTIGKLGAFPKTATKLIGVQGILKSFIYLFKKEDIPLLRAVVSALGDIAFVSQEVASYMSRDILKGVTNSLTYRDAQLKEKALGAVARFAFHSPELSERVIATGVLPDILHCLVHVNPRVKKAAIDAVIQIAKHNEETAIKVINAGGVYMILDAIKISEKTDRQKNIELLGLLAKSKETAESVERSNVSFSLMSLLKQENEPEMTESLLWTLGELAKFSKDISCKLVCEDILPIIIKIVTSDDARRCQAITLKTYKSIFDNCANKRLARIYLSANIEKIPPVMIEHATGCLSTYLQSDPGGRTSFFETGALKRLMCMHHLKSDLFLKNRQKILACYPENILRELMLRLTRDGVPWKALPPYSQSSAIWLPRPFHFLRSEMVPATQAATTADQPLTPQVSDSEMRAEMEASRAAEEATAGDIVRTTLDDVVAVATGLKPRPVADVPPSSIDVPSLEPGFDLGAIPTRFTCPVCCRLLTAADEICCKDIGNIDRTRLCHIVPQEIAVSVSDLEIGGLTSMEEEEIMDEDIRNFKQEVQDHIHYVMEAQEMFEKPRTMSLRTVVSGLAGELLTPTAAAASGSFADPDTSMRPHDDVTCCDLPSPHVHKPTTTDDIPEDDNQEDEEDAGHVWSDTFK